MDGHEFDAAKDQVLRDALLRRDIREEEISSRVAQMHAEAELVGALISHQSNTGSAAAQILDALIPDFVDFKVWKAILNGGEVVLPPEAQFGSNATRKGRQGNDYGNVHSKEMQPSSFALRQGAFVAGRARKVEGLERELAEAKHEHEMSLAALKAFAATALLTQIGRKAVSALPTGPVVVLLRAIDGVGSDDQPDLVETRTISTVLVALRENEQFRLDLRQAILRVCMKFLNHAYDRELERRDGQPYGRILNDLGHIPF